MSTETVLTVFTGIVAAALLIQSIAFWKIATSVRSMSHRIDALSEDLQRKIATVTSGVADMVVTIKPVIETIQTIQQRFVASSDVIHKRVVELDVFVQEFQDAARAQLERFQDLADGTSKKVEETVETLQRSVLAPVTEITAILRGFKTGLDFFFRGRRSPSQHSHQDEEMFI